MPTVSLVHTKGGVAKTTSAVYLATAAQRRGRDVVLIDADPQGSALEWAAAAQDDPAVSGGAGTPTLDVSGHQELTIVDTPRVRHRLFRKRSNWPIWSWCHGALTAGCPPGMADFGDHRAPPHGGAADRRRSADPTSRRGERACWRTRACR